MRVRRPHLFYGWWVVIVSLLADGMKHGTFNRGFTVLYIPIETDLHFTRTMMGLAEALGRMVGGFQGPIMGYCTDRYGPRVMLAFGGVMSGVGFILLGYTGSFWYFLVIFVGFMSVGFRSGYNNASIAAVNNWFRRRRGLAMSVVSMGNGLGGATAPLVGLLVYTVGWRDSAQFWGSQYSLPSYRCPTSCGVLQRKWVSSRTAILPIPWKPPPGSRLPRRAAECSMPKLTSPPAKRCVHRRIGCWFWPPHSGISSTPERPS